MKAHIEEILGLEEFKARLQKINVNYFNLKQELLIRNLILKMLNKKYEKANDSKYRALAEYPRDKKGRVDLSILNLKAKTYYTIELKLQFPKDKELNKLDHIDKIFNDYEREIKDKKTSMFLLIVVQWDNGVKKIYDNNFIDGKGLRPYMDENVAWKDNLIIKFGKYDEDSSLNTLPPIEINEPYKTLYNFYMLTRNS